MLSSYDRRRRRSRRPRLRHRRLHSTSRIESRRPQAVVQLDRWAKNRNHARSWRYRCCWRSQCEWVWNSRVVDELEELVSFENGQFGAVMD